MWHSQEELQHASWSHCQDSAHQHCRYPTGMLFSRSQHVLGWMGKKGAGKAAWKASQVSNLYAFIGDRKTKTKPKNQCRQQCNILHYICWARFLSYICKKRLFLMKIFCCWWRTLLHYTIAASVKSNQILWERWALMNAQIWKNSGRNY